ncbi:MAG: serine/threonine protein kinase, partial [Chloroflexi bacterium]|nr:serine/threonine protein kinase [Chloroflexota bacterium]
MDEHLRPAELPHHDARGIRAGRHPRHEGEAGDGASPHEVAAKPRPAVSIAPPDPLVPAPGALLVGRYRLTSRLAAGTADVWRAEDELLGRPVALKLAVAATQGSVAAKRLLAEGRALAAVRHPGVVGLYDVLSGRWGVALVLELLPGETLAARLARDGPVSAPIAISVAMQLAAALDAVHRAGFVHRDVKPANVIVRPDGHIRLVDFGIARMAGERHGLTPDGQVEGTLRSIAPEQLAGGPVTHATDLYGLGTVLYELLEGRPPFDVDDPARLARLQRMGRLPPVLAPAPLADLLGRLFEPNAAARPASALAVLDQLRAIAGVLGG